MDMLFRHRATDGAAHLGLASGECWLDITNWRPKEFPDLASLLRHPGWRGMLDKLRFECARGEQFLPAGLRELFGAFGLGVSGTDARELSERKLEGIGPRLLCPLDRQEIWGAGITYKRSESARVDESRLAPGIYSHVYTATRPEIFFKATAHRCAGPGEPIWVRPDASSIVPEPELGVLLTPGLEVVGYTIGNDLTARDIEGENPLYLPQAKIWYGSCAVGPVIVLEEAVGDVALLSIGLKVFRDDLVVFAGHVSLTEMVRPIQDLIGYLGRANSFPDGVVLLTGTGIVPDQAFSLRAGDVVEISVDGLGRLVNTARVAPTVPTANPLNLSAPERVGEM